MIPLAKPTFTDAEPQAAFDVVKSEWLFQGPKVKEFEKQFSKIMNVKHSIAINSGSSALLVSQMALGIKHGDEVIVPNMTFISTASSCLFLGAKPVFVDITLNDYNIDANRIEEKISEKTKVIIPVHYAGQTAAMGKIIAISKKYDIPVLEDAAEAHLAEFAGKKTGTIGDIGIFSFTPSKPMTTGEGGMIVTDSDDLADKCRQIRNFGDKKKFDWALFGFNFRMMDIQGAIGLVQLQHLKRFVNERRILAEKFNERLKDIEEIILPYQHNEKSHNYQLYTIRINSEKTNMDNNTFINLMNEKNIQTRLYYPCLHKQEVFAKSGPYNDSDFPNSLEYEKSAVSIPLYPGLTDNEVDIICTAIKEILQKK